MHRCNFHHHAVFHSASHLCKCRHLHDSRSQHHFEDLCPNLPHICHHLSIYSFHCLFWHLCSIHLHTWSHQYSGIDHFHVSCHPSTHHHRYSHQGTIFCQIPIDYHFFALQNKQLHLIALILISELEKDWIKIQELFPQKNDNSHDLFFHP